MLLTRRGAVQFYAPCISEQQAQRSLGNTTTLAESRLAIIAYGHFDLLLTDVFAFSPCVKHNWPPARGPEASCEAGGNM